MKAIFLTKYGNSDKVFEIRETEMPRPGKNEIIVKVHSFGLNFADVVARRGFYPEAPKNPAVLGYDVAGVVHEIGPEVKGFEIGQRVTALTRFGGYAEYAKTNVMGVSVIPDTVSYAEATALATQACTAYYCAEEMVSLHKGECVLVQAAAGGVGSLLVQIAKHHGCKVYGTASSLKQDFLKSLGVDGAIDYTKIDPIEFIKKDHGSGPDVVFDSIGGKSFKKSLKNINPGGKVVNFGAAAQIKGPKTNIFGALGVLLGFGIYSPLPLLMKSKSLITVNMLQVADHKPNVFNHVLNKVVEYSNKGIIKPKIAKIFKAEQIAEAHDYLEMRKSIGKIVLEWDS